MSPGCLYCPLAFSPVPSRLFEFFFCSFDLFLLDCKPPFALLRTLIFSGALGSGACIPLEPLFSFPFRFFSFRFSHCFPPIYPDTSSASLVVPIPAHFSKKILTPRPSPFLPASLPFSSRHYTIFPASRAFSFLSHNPRTRPFIFLIFFGLMVFPSSYLPLSPDMFFLNSVFFPSPFPPSYFSFLDTSPVFHSSPHVRPFFIDFSSTDSVRTAFQLPRTPPLPPFNRIRLSVAPPIC